MIREAQLLHPRPGPRRERGRTGAGFAPGEAQRARAGSLAVGSGPRCAKQTQFCARDGLPRPRSERGQVRREARLRVGPIVSNEPNFRVSGLKTRVGVENKANLRRQRRIPAARRGPAPNKANLRGRGPGALQREMSNKANSARPKVRNAKSETLNPEGVQWPEDERRNAKQSQSGKSGDAPRRHRGHGDGYNYIKRKGLYAKLRVLCGSVVNRRGPGGTRGGRCVKQSQFHIG